jgi:hypothetical protein
MIGSDYHFKHNEGYKQTTDIFSSLNTMSHFPPTTQYDFYETNKNGYDFEIMGNNHSLFVMSNAQTIHPTH